MTIRMNQEVGDSYRSRSQLARVITERWVSENLFCPRCGNPRITQFENNRPVADFYCPVCGSQYELKSKNGRTLDLVMDGAFDTMIARITSLENPDFLFLSYARTDWSVRNLFFVPKHFFTPSIIVKRKPLAPGSRRAGWIGCNILLRDVPATGRIPIIENGAVCSSEEVRRRVAAADSLYTEDLSARGWLFDVLCCVESFGPRSFTLSELYAFEEKLAVLHPENHNIRPKIRQQLQILRDRGILEFQARGIYRRMLP